MRGVDFKKTISGVKITLSADEWELYSSSMDCSDAASDLNRTLEKALAAPGATKSSVHHAMGPVMEKWAKWGACDTEPCAVLYDILDEVFGEDE